MNNPFRIPRLQRFFHFTLNAFKFWLNLFWGFKDQHSAGFEPMTSQPRAAFSTAAATATFGRSKFAFIDQLSDQTSQSVSRISAT